MSGSDDTKVITEDGHTVLIISHRKYTKEEVHEKEKSEEFARAYMNELHKSPWMPRALAVAYLADIKGWPMLSADLIIHQKIANGEIAERDGAAPFFDPLDKLARQGEKPDVLREDIDRHWPGLPGMDTLAAAKMIGSVSARQQAGVEPTGPLPAGAAEVDRIGSAKAEILTSYKTGFAGRPTSKNLIESECRRRWDAGERHPDKIGGQSRSDWANALIAWLASEHREAPQPRPQTVKNMLPALFRELEGTPEIGAQN